MNSSPANAVDREMEALLELISTGKKDSTAVRLARERGDLLREEMRKKYGHRNIAVELVQKSRDGE